jgi:hypothetical protein
LIAISAYVELLGDPGVRTGSPAASHTALAPVPLEDNVTLN